MQDVYKECPIIQNDRFLLRLVSENDVNDLLKVYGDKKALPYFNSDNCHGDNFYYPTKKGCWKQYDFGCGNIQKEDMCVLLFLMKQKMLRLAQ